MLTDKNTRIKKLKKAILIRKRIVTALKEWYYALFFLVLVLGVLYLLFSNFNTVIYWCLVGAFVFSILFIMKCYFLIQRFEKEQTVLSTELYRIQKL